jgi:hypothetical protein
VYHLPSRTEHENSQSSRGALGALLYASDAST